MTAVALIHRDTIIERLANGEFLKDIAADLKVKPPSISRPLANDPEYQAARKSGAELRLETHFQKLASAEYDAKDESGNTNLQDAANLARVREAAWKAAAWFAEREFPERWGQRSHVTVARDDGLGERLRRARERVIEPESVADAPQIADAALNKPVDISHGAVDQQQSVDK